MGKYVMASQIKLPFAECSFISPITDSQELRDNDVVVKQTYQNFTGSMLHLRDRRGVVFAVDPQPGRVKCLRVTVNYTARAGLLLDVRRELLNRVDSRHDPEFKVIVSEAERIASSGNSFLSQFTIVYEISAEDIENSEPNVYYEDIDVVVCSSGQSRTSHHPFDRPARESRGIADIYDEFTRKSVFFAFKLIDNSDEPITDARFIAYGGRVYKIPVEKSTILADGMHVFSRVPHNEVDDSNEPYRRSHYTLDVADKIFSLHRSYESAAAKPMDSEEIEKARISREELAIKKEEQALKTEGQRIKKKEQKTAKAVAEQKAEVVSLESRFLQEKYERERYMADVKHKSDNLAATAAVCAGVLTFLGIAVKLFMVFL